MTRSRSRRTAGAGAAAIAVFVMNGFGVSLPASAASVEPLSIDASDRAGVLVPGHYDVHVRYDTIGATDVTIDVNSRRLVAESVPAAGEWSITTRVHLDQGMNEITIGSSTGVWLSDVSTTPVPGAEHDAGADTVV